MYIREKEKVFEQIPRACKVVCPQSVGEMYREVEHQHQSHSTDSFSHQLVKCVQKV